jgi:hypothetical protein
MERTSEPQETLIVYSMWAVAYCQVSGVEIVGTVFGNYGRMGWQLDNADGRAKQLLDEWRSGEAVVNGRALIDTRSRLMDDAKNLT